jgi:DNA modification methylase
MRAYGDVHTTVYNDDCLTVLKGLPDRSVHAVVTDPPYAIESRPVDLTGYAGTDEAVCEQCGESQSARAYRVCEGCLDDICVDALMGAPMLGMQSQNWHEKATHSRGYANNDNVVFQRWCALWLQECLRVLMPGGHLAAFGGTRTWHRLAVAAEDAGFEVRDSLAWLFGTGFPKSLDIGAAASKHLQKTLDGTEAAQIALEWAGWSTTLKPGFEPIVLARKPLEGTVVENALKYGTGGLNVKGSRGRRPHAHHDGRWRSNVCLDHDQAAALDLDAGEPVSRFFWVAKPHGSERVRVGGVAHPTVKPLDLMQELVALVSRPGQVVLDPFAGSGTTVEACLLEGVDVIAVERETEFVPLIRHRIDRRLDPLKAGRDLDQSDTPDLFTGSV